MEQILFLLTENSSLIAAVILLLLCLLQAASLRRINKAGKQIELARMDMIHSMDMLLKEKEELLEKLAAEERNRTMAGEEGGMGPKDTKEAQGKLIDAVLSEVFS